MTLVTGEFIRRFLRPAAWLPPHPPLRPVRQRHARDNIAERAACSNAPVAQPEAGDANCAGANEPKPLSQPCQCRMIIIETFQRGSSPRYRPAASTAVISIDTS
jgi:hypothetical protein